MSTILLEETPTEYAQKRAMLLRHGIALWDVIHFAEREGSLDTNIKNPTPNDFDTFFAEHPLISRVFLNGGKAASLFAKNYKGDKPVFQLPSSSPAHANLRFEQKLEIWSAAIKPYL